MAEHEYRVEAIRRLNKDDQATGIFIRARDGDKWVSADLAELDKGSVLAWLRSRGGDNPWAENCVGMLLGHGALHEVKD